MAVVGVRGDLKSGGLGNRVFAKDLDGGDFVKASSRCRVVPGPSLVPIPAAVVVCTSTGGKLPVVASCFFWPKSTRVIAFTVVCRVPVSASKLVLGVVARVLGFPTKVGGT